MLVNVEALLAAFESERPDPANPAERVSFGTSGHRGSSFHRTFNEDHIAAIARAIGEYRAAQKVDGPLYLGRDTHALSLPATRVAVECLAAMGVRVLVAAGDGYTPTPVVSFAILEANRGRTKHLADGIVVTPSHNPPEDGGFKYDPPHGGPADTEVTTWIENRANELLIADAKKIPRIPYERAAREGLVSDYDFITPYIDALPSVVDIDLIAKSGIRLGADPMGGASVGYWGRIAERHGLQLEVVRKDVDPTFRFIPVDHDGKIRTDCSSPFAMANLLAIRDRFDLSFGNDADADRHGIVSRAAGLVPPNHFLAVCADYLLGERGGRGYAAHIGLGKTVVSSSILDRVARSHDRRLLEVPVGFKWFVAGLHEGSIGFSGEESAGGSFLRRDASVWTTDKDGLILDLLAAEILAKTQKDPASYYAGLERTLGSSTYTRIDEPATLDLRNRIKKLRPEDVTATTLAGDPITNKLTNAKGNNAPIGGLKVESENGWFALRPSGTENIYKVYAESFRGKEHLDQIVDEARALVANVKGGAQ